MPREELVRTPPRSGARRSRRSESRQDHRHGSRSPHDRTRSRRGRTRSRSHHSRNCSHSRRDGTRSRSRNDISRSRSLRNRSRYGDHSSRERSRSRTHHRLSESRSYPHDASVKNVLGTIMSRLTATEENTASGSRVTASIRDSTPPLDKNNVSTTQALVEALGVLTKNKSSNYYVSNFDPAINNFEVWCNEVDRARHVNHWDDLECFSRVAHCLKGDAKTWLNEWATNDRSWSNFVKEFKSLCPRKINYALTLHEVINTTSDKFSSYAEYARRSLLKLRLVKGLSEELMVQIVVHGISDVQVRAAAINADLTSENLVSFLATYVKPIPKFYIRNLDKSASSGNTTKRRNSNGPSRSDNKCFHCGQTGHYKNKCPNKGNVNNKDGSSNNVKPTCSFCKKVGHKESDCFAKARTESQNNNNNRRKVNLCSELSTAKDNNDISTAVIQGIPVDILIDSGALNVSLISAAEVSYFSGPRKQIKCSLKGISDKEIVAHEYITLTVEFSNIALEVDFVIVPTSCMNTPIIIGTDVLNREGVTFIRTKHGQYLTRTPDGVLKVNTVSDNEPDKINTPLKGAELVKLMGVIDEFSPFLISGTATTTVKTGKMHIKLTSDVPVAYHPYRLSYQEKLKVREICQDLLHKKIILTTKVEYLGRVISHGQVRPSPHKIEALVNTPIPSNVRPVRQFLGLAGYFRRYIEDYATKTACISRLTKKDVKFEWGPDQDQVRQDLIKRLTSEPILAISEPKLPTELHTDPSSAGYGAVLMQVHVDGRVNRQRHPPRVFQVNDQVFVIKYSQSAGKLDPGMRGPYRVTKVLPSDRYELKLLSGARGKTTQAAALYMVPWKGEWCPESCAAYFENCNDDDPDNVGEPTGASACSTGASSTDETME